MATINTNIEIIFFSKARKVSDYSIDKYTNDDGTFKWNKSRFYSVTGLTNPGLVVQFDREYARTKIDSRFYKSGISDSDDFKTYKLIDKNNGSFEIQLNKGSTFVFDQEVKYPSFISIGVSPGVDTINTIDPTPVPLSVVYYTEPIIGDHHFIFEAINNGGIIELSQEWRAVNKLSGIVVNGVELETDGYKNIDQTLNEYIVVNNEETQVRHDVIIPTIVGSGVVTLSGLLSDGSGGNLPFQPMMLDLGYNGFSNRYVFRTEVTAAPAAQGEFLINYVTGDVDVFVTNDITDPGMCRYYSDYMGKIVFNKSVLSFVGDGTAGSSNAPTLGTLPLFFNAGSVSSAVERVILPNAGVVSDIYVAISDGTSITQYTRVYTSDVINPGEYFINMFEGVVVLNTVGGLTPANIYIGYTSAPTGFIEIEDSNTIIPSLQLLDKENSDGIVTFSNKSTVIDSVTAELVSFNTFLGLNHYQSNFGTQLVFRVRVLSTTGTPVPGAIVTMNNDNSISLLSSSGPSDSNGYAYFSASPIEFSGFGRLIQLYNWQIVSGGNGIGAYFTQGSTTINTFGTEFIPAYNAINASPTDYVVEIQEQYPVRKSRLYRIVSATPSTITVGSPIDFTSSSSSTIRSGSYINIYKQTTSRPEIDYTGYPPTVVINDPFIKQTMGNAGANLFIYEANSLAGNTPISILTINGVTKVLGGTYTAMLDGSSNQINFNTAPNGIIDGSVTIDTSVTSLSYVPTVPYNETNDVFGYYLLSDIGSANVYFSAKDSFNGNTVNSDVIVIDSLLPSSYYGKFTLASNVLGSGAFIR